MGFHTSMTRLRLFSALAASAFAATLFAGSPWGIMSHPLWSKDPQDLEMEVKRTKEAGMKYYRTDFNFSGIAGKKGEYDFSRHDGIVDKLTAAGIEVLPVLQGYDWEVAGKRPDAVPLYRHPEEWRSYVRAVAEHYRGKVRAYEIWNEQDGGFWKPSPNAAQYVPLLKIAYEEIKKTDPEAIVIVGGLCGWNVDYMRDIYHHGGKGFFDAVAVHPYGWGPDVNPGAAAQFDAFKKLLAGSGDAKKKLWLTEFGTSTFHSSLLNQQPDVFLRAIEFALKKIGRPLPPGPLKIGVPAELRNPGKIVDEPRKWLPGVEFVKLTPERLADLDPAEIPVYLGCESLHIEADYLEPSRDFVRKGGVLLAFGPVPYYVKNYRQPNGNWIAGDSAGELHPYLRIGFEAWWTKKGVPQSTFNIRTAPGMEAEGIKALRNVYVTRFLSPKNLKANDTYTPIVEALDSNGRPVGEALALYTFDDWKGAILGCTMLFNSGLSEEEQANLIQRNYLGYLAGGVDKLFVYNLRDKGTNRAEKEDNFGIVHRDFSPKKAYLAYQEMTAKLGAEPEFVRNLSPGPNVQALLFRRAEDGRQILAVWGTGPEISYRVNAQPFKGVKVRFFDADSTPSVSALP